MTMYLALRVLHIMMATIWVGATVASTFFFLPAIGDAKAAGGQVMTAVARRGYMAFIQSVAGLSTLTGLYLYWRYTGGFDPAISASMAARVFGVGGVAGILATIIGGAVIGRNAKKVRAIMVKAASMAEGSEKAALLQHAAALQQTMATAGRVTLVLMLIAIVTMSIGHYV